MGLFCFSSAFFHYILDIFSAITGARVYPAGYICPGGLMRDIPQGIEKEISKVLKKTKQGFSYFKKEDPLFRSRTKGIGILKSEDAINMGATGQVLRATGVSYDVRKSAPYEIYQKVNFNLPVLQDGDSYSRFRLGLLEADQSIEIIEQLLNKIPSGEYLNKKMSTTMPFVIPDNEVYVRNETARGEGAMYIKGNGKENPYRVKIKGPSFTHLIPILEFLLKDAEIADIPIIYWSLNGCPADMDR
ncbi:MAG: hypothetical protein U9Q16_01415 [Patescibacteria group bacterium]|nr:hypothetical protein [Patescibacteria group bacterium]